MTAPGSAVTRVMAIDLGSSAIKVATADVADGAPLAATEIRRIPHRPRWGDGVLAWDLEPLVADLVRAESRRAPDLVVTLDGWGSDIALLDGRGRRLGPLRSYRDPGLAAGLAEARVRGVDELLVARTGCAVTRDSTVSQLLAWQLEAPPWWGEVRGVLPLVDALALALTGRASAGVSALSTTGVLLPAAATVARDALDALGLDGSWFPDPVVEGFEAGPVAIDGLAPGSRVRLVKVAGHDTASALAAGRLEAGAAFASLGSWAVVGAVCSDDARSRAPFARPVGLMHEFTGDGRLRVNRNLPGMRLVQGLEREWFGEVVPAGAREVLLAGAETADEEEALDPAVLDAVPVGELDLFIRAAGAARGLAVATRAERYGQALRAIARGVAGTLDELGAAGLVDDGPVWVCGGGAAVGPLVRGIEALTGRRVEIGPIDASAEGGVRGAARLTGVT